MDFALWRSALGDTWPHAGLHVELDWWPQSAHLVSPAHGLFLCATGEGGGSQQAMFRTRLVPLLDQALARWRANEVEAAAGPEPAPGPGARLGALFAEAQRGFEAMTEPPCHDQYQASAVGLLLDGDRCGIVSTGLERAYRLRRGRFEQISQDRYCTPDVPAPEDLTPDILEALALMRRWPGAYLGVWGQARWQVVELPLEPGDLFLLLTGLAWTSIDHAQLAEALSLALPASAPEIPLPEAAQALGELLAHPDHFHAAASPEEACRARWHVVSQTALALVRVG